MRLHAVILVAATLLASVVCITTAVPVEQSAPLRRQLRANDDDTNNEERVAPGMATKTAKSLKKLKAAEDKAELLVRVGTTPTLLFQGTKLANLPRSDLKWLTYSKLKKLYKEKNPGNYDRPLRPQAKIKKSRN